VKREKDRECRGDLWRKAVFNSLFTLVGPPLATPGHSIHQLNALLKGRRFMMNRFAIDRFYMFLGLERLKKVLP